MVLFEVWNKAVDANVSALSLIQSALISPLVLWFGIFKLTFSIRLRIVQSVCPKLGSGPLALMGGLEIAVKNVFQLFRFARRHILCGRLPYLLL